MSVTLFRHLVSIYVFSEDNCSIIAQSGAISSLSIRVARRHCCQILLAATCYCIISHLCSKSRLGINCLLPAVIFHYLVHPQMIYVGIFTQCGTERTPSVMPSPLSSLTVRKRHDGPFPAPGPLTRLGTAASRQCTELLILASGETDNGVSLASAEG